MDRIKLMREKEKEIKKLWDDLYAVKDLKYLLEDRFYYKTYVKELIQGILFVILWMGLFFILWFLLP